MSVKLLFDANLSYRLCAILKDSIPTTIHVKDLNLDQASDRAIWETAKDKKLVIVSKDSDFHQRSFLLGAPPKVIWIRRGNCSTLAIGQLLRDNLGAIEKFCADLEATFLVIE